MPPVACGGYQQAQSNSPLEELHPVLHYSCPGQRTTEKLKWSRKQKEPERMNHLYYYSPGRPAFICPHGPKCQGLSRHMFNDTILQFQLCQVMGFYRRFWWNITVMETKKKEEGVFFGMKVNFQVEREQLCPTFSPSAFQLPHKVQLFPWRPRNTKIEKYESRHSANVVMYIFYLYKNRFLNYLSFYWMCVYINMYARLCCKTLGTT